LLRFGCRAHNDKTPPEPGLCRSKPLAAYRFQADRRSPGRGPMSPGDAPGRTRQKPLVALRWSPLGAMRVSVQADRHGAASNRAVGYEVD
jgi:hypothetical protein